MPEEPEADVPRVEAAIEAYLARHPDAADSTLGIAHWWLPSVGVDATPAQVAAALERLMAAGRIERVEPGGVAVIYRAARGRAAGREQGG